jgi:hypothetical protein
LCATGAAVLFGLAAAALLTVFFLGSATTDAGSAASTGLRLGIEHFITFRNVS